MYIYLSICPSGTYGMKCFFFIVGRNLNSVVRITFIFYSFMLLVRNTLIFQGISKNIPHLIYLFSFFILVD